MEIKITRDKEEWGFFLFSSKSTEEVCEVIADFVNFFMENNDKIILLEDLCQRFADEEKIRFYENSRCLSSFSEEEIDLTAEIDVTQRRVSNWAVLPFEKGLWDVKEKFDLCGDQYKDEETTVSEFDFNHYTFAQARAAVEIARKASARNGVIRFRNEYYETISY